MDKFGPDKKYDFDPLDFIGDLIPSIEEEIENIKAGLMIRKFGTNWTSESPIFYLAQPILGSEFNSLRDYLIHREDFGWVIQEGQEFNVQEILGVQDLQILERIEEMEDKMELSEYTPCINDGVHILDEIDEDPDFLFCEKCGGKFYTP